MLSLNFSLDELTASQTATRQGIKNTPSAAVVENLRMLAALLEQIRTLLGGRSIHISSGYRSLMLNRYIGSRDLSAHVRGYAADFTCPAFGKPIEVAKEIAESNLKFDQLICENNAWIHISCDPMNRRQLLTARFKDGHTYYTTGIA
jgi:hypothetical protein